MALSRINNPSLIPKGASLTGITAFGSGALNGLTTGTNNTALGYQAAYNTTTGATNTAVGYQTLRDNVTGTQNAGFGAFTLQASTSSNNAGFGYGVLAGVTSGGNNTAMGYLAGQSTTTGTNNVAFGAQALNSNTTASNNTGIGHEAGFSNTTGANNTALGQQALRSNTTASRNTAVGYQAGYSLTTGFGNTFIGTSGTYQSAGYYVTTGNNNTVIGGYNGNNSGLDIRTASNHIVLSDGDGNLRQYFDSSGNAYFQYNNQSPTAAPSGISLTGPVNQQLQIYILKATQAEAHIGYKSSTDTNFYVGTSNGINGIGTYGLYQQNVTNSWTSLSDERTKTELEPITNALEKVANVRTVTGRFTHDEENGITRRLPFLIAQDFVTALPEAVDQQNPDKLGLSYSDTIVLAFAAIKELKAEFDAYKATHP
jgi:hypothetical protein